MNQTSLEQRRKIQSLVAAGKKSPAIAKELNISVWTVRKWRQRLKKGVHCILKWVVLRVAI